MACDSSGRWILWNERGCGRGHDRFVGDASSGVVVVVDRTETKGRGSAVVVETETIR